MNLKQAKKLRKAAKERYGPRGWKAAYKWMKKQNELVSKSNK